MRRESNQRYNDKGQTIAKPQYWVNERILGSHGKIIPSGSEGYKRWAPLNPFDPKGLLSAPMALI